MPQQELTPAALAQFLQQATRENLLACASTARCCARLDAAAQVVAACEELVTA